MSDLDGDEPAPKPKRDTRFQKGQSGNPSGRPRKDRSNAPEFDIKATLEKALNAKVKLTAGGRTTTVTANEVAIRTLVTQYAKGDSRARRDLFELARRAGIDLLGENRQVIEEALTESHQQILDEYFFRRSGKITSKPELAPPDLLDGL